MNAASTNIFSLAGKGIWVFGGAGPLGRPTVSLLSTTDARILCVDLEDRAAALVSAARLEANVTPATADVRDVPALKQLVASFVIMNAASFTLAVCWPSPPRRSRRRNIPNS